jgi:hypothetical protein
VLVVNAGSGSLKLSILGPGENTLDERNIESPFHAGLPAAGPHLPGARSLAGSTDYAATVSTVLPMRGR